MKKRDLFKEIAVYARAACVYEWDVETIEDVLANSPIYHEYIGELGTRNEQYVLVTGVTSKGEKIPLRGKMYREWSDGTSDHSQEEVPSVGEQIEGTDVVLLELIIGYNNEFQQESWEEVFQIPLPSK